LIAILNLDGPSQVALVNEGPDVANSTKTMTVTPVWVPQCDKLEDRENYFFKSILTEWGKVGGWGAALGITHRVHQNLHGCRPTLKDIHAVTH